MATTSFVNGVTLTDSDWFDDADFLIYDLFGDSTTTASAASRLAPSFNNLTVAGTLSVSAASTFRAIAATDVSASSVAGLAVATQAQMETDTSTTTIATPGRLRFSPGVAKAWVTFNGALTSPTAAASYNVSQIVDVAIGVWEVVYTTSFSSSSYIALLTHNATGNIGTLRSVSAGRCTLVVTDSLGSAFDAGIICFAAFGDFE